MAQFYGTKMESDEKRPSFGTILEQKLKQVILQYPDKFSDTMYWNCVRERFFHGLSKNMRTNLRTQPDGGANYYKLLELARMIESENFQEDAKTEVKPTNQKGKAKVGAVTTDNTAHKFSNYKVQSRTLLNSYSVINKILNHNRFHNLYQNLYKIALIFYHRLPKTKTLLILKVVEVAEVGLEVEVVEVDEV